MHAESVYIAYSVQNASPLCTVPTTGTDRLLNIIKPTEEIIIPVSIYLIFQLEYTEDVLIPLKYLIIVIKKEFAAP